ncbi:hypothetical protein HU675_0035485 [Bradyrhizobium septentrionale]|uniref:hypothetical protein n=1 Tax=Bradyrhizobium septentrionale TaxID=1404411 RepID=UPI0015964D94|nr:hypothetical protein [Bradyrhizobium septentrionale]UGY23222.1 hypothetical protein HU675_0035485 [Bradyrhizobium septentrionale]
MPASAAPGQGVSVHGETAIEIGTPLVELRGALEYLQHLTPDQADEFAAGLQLAARKARGEPVPSPLDQLLARPRG